MGVSELRADLRPRPRPGHGADRVGDVSRRLKRTQEAQDPERAAAAAAFLESQEITTTDGRRCGSHIAGVNGRYACGACGWTNHWSEGSRELPPMEPAENVAE